MKASPFDRVPQRHRDFLLVGLILLCILQALCAVHSGLVHSESVMNRGGARSVDAAVIKNQILDGSLSPRKALYYRMVPR
ncbi:MAG: hypothetical protein V1792_07730 [Pseudomonadota bacterium]